MNSPQQQHYLHAMQFSLGAVPGAVLPPTMQTRQRTTFALNQQGHVTDSNSNIGSKSNTQ
jgi:hypothetical protein